MRFGRFFDRQNAESGSRDSSKWRKGFTLLEALVVLGLIAIIVAIALPFFYRILQQYRVQTAAQQLAINIRFARNAAVKQKINYQITIRDETDGTNPNTYIFEYDPQRDNPPTYEAYTKLDVSIPDGVIIKSGGVSQIAFDSRGRANPSGGVVTLEGEFDTQYTITISLNGGVYTEKI